MIANEAEDVERNVNEKRGNEPNQKENERTNNEQAKAKQPSQSTIALSDGSKVRLVIIGRRPLPWYIRILARGMIRRDIDGYLVAAPWGAAYAFMNNIQLACYHCGYRLEQLTMNEDYEIFLIQKTTLNISMECLAMCEEMLRPSPSEQHRTEVKVNGTQ